MVWATGAILTVIVVLYVGYPLFVRECVEPEEDALEAAIAQRRSKGRAGVANRPAGEIAVARRGMQRCAKCGVSNLAEDRFCARCGTQLGQACAKCGAEYDAGDVFCARCGARLAGR